MSNYDSSLPIRTENAGDAIVKVADATVPSQQLKVNADGSIDTNFAPGSSVEITDGTDTLEINADGSINSVVTATDLDIRDLVFATDKVDVSGSDVTVSNTVTVQSTDLDIRDLDSAQDSVEVLQATHDNLNLNANIQVGDTDISNGNPVPISDAGGSLTVDATDLDIRDLSASQDNVAISDGTDTLAVNADGSINSVVSATDLDIRDLTHVSDSIRIGDGTDFLAVNADGSINVVPQEDAGTEIVDYNKVTDLAANATSNHDYTFTNAAKLYQVMSTGSGKIMIEVQVETGAATNTFNTICVRLNSTANPNADMELQKYAAVPAGARVRVIRTNEDKQPFDIHSTIIAVES